MQLIDKLASVLKRKIVIIITFGKFFHGFFQFVNLQRICFCTIWNGRQLMLRLIFYKFNFGLLLHYSISFHCTYKSKYVLNISIAFKPIMNHYGLMTGWG